MVLRIVEPQLAAKRLDSVADIPPDVRVVADPERLRGILLTLVSNAIRFTEPGGHVMIDVGYPEGMPEDVVMIRVGDSGCGISTERQQEIFEPSAPARHPAESNAGGTGPGLVNSRLLGARDGRRPPRAERRGPGIGVHAEAAEGRDRGGAGCAGAGCETASGRSCLPRPFAHPRTSATTRPCHHDRHRHPRPDRRPVRSTPRASCARPRRARRGSPPSRPAPSRSVASSGRCSAGGRSAPSRASGVHRADGGIAGQAELAASRRRGC